MYNYRVRTYKIGDTMKKLISLFLILISILALASCGGGDYPPVKSNDVESQTVMTISLEGKKYEVKYELYRALFLNLRESVDNGDSSVWSGEKKDEYIEKIDTLIKGSVTDIYSVLHVAKKVGIDPYSKDFDKLVKAFIEVSVEGGYYDEDKIIGFDGDYDKYLASLKEMNLNYSVQDLIIRYQLASEKLFEYYAGYLHGEFIEETVKGALEYTAEDVKAFYESDECVRVLTLYLPKANFTKERAEQIREDVIEASTYGDDAVATLMINRGNPAIAASEVFRGSLIGRHNLDSAFSGDMENVAFALSPFGVSEVLSVNDGYEDSYVILYRALKSDTVFEENRNYFTSEYVQNEIGKIIDTAADAMEESLTVSELLFELDRSNISMD